MNVLLVRPAFDEARNNIFNNMPLGLLKIAAWKKSLGDKVFYINGKFFSEDLPSHTDEIWITSMFTYESSSVINEAIYWQIRHPKAKVHIGGIAATLIPDYFKEKVPFATIVEGYHVEAERFVPDYSILLTDDDKINNTHGCSVKR